MKNLFAGAAVLALSAMAAGSAAAQTIDYVTDFAKTNDIYTNLNERFPNTGPGVPGSGVGTPNASYLFTPGATGSASNELNNVNNGVSFSLVSNATGHDFTEIGGGGTLNVPVSIGDATNVYILGAAYFGVTANFTFTATNGVSETFSNINLPDFNGGYTNYAGTDFFDNTVFQVTNVGAGGSGNSTNGDYNAYRLNELGFTLSSDFAGQTLTSIAVNANNSTALILGITVASSDSPAGGAGGVPEPASWALMILGFGGVGAALRRRTPSQVLAV